MYEEDEFQPGSFVYDGKYDQIGSERRFGVELEYQVCPDFWEVETETIFGGKEDCSLNEGGGEFYSPPMKGNKGLQACLDFCKLAERNSFDPGPRDAGYHLHVDLNDLEVESVRSVFTAYKSTEWFWFRTVPSHRRSGSWARPISWSVDSAFPNKAALKDWAEYRRRYDWANVNAYYKFGTIEVRVHESTIDGPTVVNWIKAHTRFVDAVSELTPGQVIRILGGKPAPEIFRELRCMIRQPEVSEHLKARYRQYSRGVSN